MSDSYCDHLPTLSEPSLTLCCATCGAWLKQRDDDVLVPVDRKDATRAMCVFDGIEDIWPCGGEVMLRPDGEGDESALCEEHEDCGPP